MNQPLLAITMEIGDSQALEALEALPYVRVSRLPAPGSDCTLALAAAPPDILILDDRLEQIDTVSRLQALKQRYAATEILIVSTDKRPQHVVSLMKAGASGYLGNPLKVIDLVAAIDEIRLKKLSKERGRKGIMHSFVGSKGGLGTTVLAVNCAAALAEITRQPVLLSDLSLQSSDASVLLDIPPGPTIVDLSRNIHRLDDSLFRGAVTRHNTGLEFLAAPQDPAESAEINAEQTARILALASRLYAHVIVDCPALSHDDCSLTALKASEQIFIVSDLSVTAVRNASRYSRLLTQFGIDPERINFVINRYIKGSTLAIDEVEATLRRPVFWLFPSDFGQVVSSINRGIPLVKLHAHTPLAKNISGFVAKLQDPAACGSYRGLKGAFGKAI